MKITRKEHTIVETDKGYIIRIDFYIFNYWLISSYVDDEKTRKLKKFKTYNQAKNYINEI